MVTLTAALFLLLMAVTLSAEASHANVPSETYQMVLVKGDTQELRLETNPSTGLVWWIETMPNSVFVQEVRKEPGTISCLSENPPPPGCGQLFQVFSISSNAIGQYVVEFRLGRTINRTEYYRVAYLNLEVVDSASPAAIPGFPLESIALGLVAGGLALFAVYRRKRTINGSSVGHLSAWDLV